MSTTIGAWSDGPVPLRASRSMTAPRTFVANAGVAKTLYKFTWRGQPHRLGFDLHVPWESPEGASPGLVSA